ncbi:FABP family protein [Rathayibacter sp. AY1G1]|uniref:FABP family protein n=1 Tax=unclassified Rathayibacter TaxID=2609250 RepID=UPI000CE8F009|nr:MULTISPECIES: FABP family protein [unclassified Rathayibacter]PPF09824.1 FABP family protein [Rathayibacter sp. AY1A5]PPF19768.1 FABP family protein [Rathayibacter sp. AY1A4]PPF20792.1 FABP family protein [Rathayibacter sp. AY1A7]PPF28107.1 FABP family protein [Rathayibacter sp. AY1F2]PPF37236.1 FABP family protein [Rathayibacter sp. AY1A3]
MISLPSGLPPELVPLSWLLGVWEGSGVIDYTIGDDSVQAEFGHRISFSYDGLPYLNYNSYTWLIEEGAEEAPRPLVTETGYWRLSRALTDSDAGPGMLPGRGAPAFPDAESVETLRNAAGGFDIEVSLVHPDGVSELYLGQVKGPRIDLATDAVMRTAAAKDYAAATRLYGLVDDHLLWAWDIAALGQGLRTHSSGRLARVD